MSRVDPAKQVAFVDEVFAAQAEQVSAIRPVGRRGQAQQEAGREMLDQLLIGAGGGVVEFINHDVVEMVPVELAQVTDAAQRLDRGEEDFRIRLFLGARVAAELGLGAHLAKGRHRLGQNFVAMGNEEDAARLGTDRVEGGQPGLSQSGGQHDKPGAVAVRSALRERRQCLLLDRVRLWRRAFLGDDAGGELGHRPRPAAFRIGIDPGGRQRLDLRACQQVLKGRSDAVRCILGMQVPFHAIGQRRLGQVRATDNRRPACIGGAEQPGLGMKAEAARLEHEELRAFQVQQARQGGRVGRVEIIAHHDPEPSAARQQLAEPGLEQGHAAVHGEGNRQVDRLRRVQPFGEQRQKRIAAAGCQTCATRFPQVEMVVIG